MDGEGDGGGGEVGQKGLGVVGCCDRSGGGAGLCFEFRSKRLHLLQGFGIGFFLNLLEVVRGVFVVERFWRKDGRLFAGLGEGCMCGEDERWEVSAVSSCSSTVVCGEFSDQ